jgi:transposase
MSLLELFCSVDDFWKAFEPTWYQRQLTSGDRQRQRSGELTESEMMTIVIHFHPARYRDFKTYYTQYVQVYLRREFPTLISYARFVQRLPALLDPLAMFLHSRFGACTGIAFIDSTALSVCDNRRIHAHRVFDGRGAARGKTSMGWFFGFKLHLIVNGRGELLAIRLTPGNVDDRKPVPALVKRLFGKLFGDKGYLSRPLQDQLRAQDVELITNLKSNMKNQLMLLSDKLLLRKRAIIESIIDQLKNISQIQHTRHRSPVNFMVHLLAGLTAYCFQPKKPSLGLDKLLVLAPPYP